MSIEPLGRSARGLMHRLRRPSYKKLYGVKLPKAPKPKPSPAILAGYLTIGSAGVVVDEGGIPLNTLKGGL